MELFTGINLQHDAGKNIENIFSILHYPNQTEVHELTSLTPYRIIFDHKDSSHLDELCKIHQLHSDEDKLLLDLIYKMLTYNPYKRITANNALNHEYFRYQPKLSMHIENIRNITKEWMINMASIMQLSESTTALIIKIFDICIDQDIKKIIKEENMQSIAFACLILASKLSNSREVTYVELENFTVDDTINIDEVIEMQNIILEMLINYDLLNLLE